MISFSGFLFYFSFIVLGIYLLIFLFLIVGWLSTKTFFSDEKIISGNTKITVIIPVRNEEKNIFNCLESLSCQSYPKALTQLILIDDFSEDETILVAKKANEKFHFENFILLKSEKPGKKNALTKGIEKADGTLIITTDADCTFSEKWLSTVVLFYEKEQPSFIFAPVVFINEKNIFEKIQSLEFCGLIVAGAASARFNFPLMCNGANLAYEKNIFQTVNGFEGNEHIDSGDDLFLMEKISRVTSAKIKFLKSAEAIVKTSASPDLKSFIEQRKRWASKAIHLKSKMALFFGVIIWLINFFILCNLFLIGYNSSFVALFLILFISKCIIDFLFLFLAVSFFEKKKHFVYCLFLQVFYPMYVLWVSICGISGKIKWKNRSISI